jgi:hypothetical protein
MHTSYASWDGSNSGKQSKTSVQPLVQQSTHAHLLLVAAQAGLLLLPLSTALHRWPA